MKKLLVIHFQLFITLFLFGQTQNVQWQNLENAVANGNTLTKTGNSGWNAGGSSVQELPPSTDGYVEMTISQDNTHRFFGLSSNDTDVHFRGINYSIFLISNRSFRIYESGTYKGSFGEYTVGDRFRIARTNGKIQYFLNNTPLYTSDTENNTRLVADVSIYHEGGTVSNVVISSNGACVDADGDGVCVAEDCDDTNPNLPANQGTACDDNNPDTENDVILADGCTCRGESVGCIDGDNDGICRGNDCDDNNPNLPTTQGTACDDGNANTSNDIIQADGCTCAGTMQPDNSAGIWTETSDKIYHTGKVLIGPANTPVPGDYNLYVTKGILSERVRVAQTEGNWADFVFEKDYPLNTLSFVEQYILANKHLPNVPSAKEVGKEGVDLGAMDAVLLRQIEELWLHTIELNKQVELLQKEIEQLKKP